jgi:hypothetical protein
MRRRPIGQILVEKQAITEEDLAAALAEQERSGRRLGEILIQQGRTSWLALARAMAEQVLDIQNPPAGPEPEEKASPDPVEQVRELAEKLASLPAVPDPLPPPEMAPARVVAAVPAEDPERELARAVAEQVAGLDAPVVEQTHLLRLTPTKNLQGDPQTKLETIEAMLRERQRAFIELLTTAENLRSRVGRLEDELAERTRELARLRVTRSA